MRKEISTTVKLTANLTWALKKTSTNIKQNCQYGIYLIQMQIFNTDKRLYKKNRLIHQPQGGSDIIGLIFLHKILNNSLSSSFGQMFVLKWINSRFVLLWLCVISPLSTARSQEVVQVLDNIKAHRPGRQITPSTFSAEKTTAKRSTPLNNSAVRYY